MNRNECAGKGKWLYQSLIDVNNFELLENTGRLLWVSRDFVVMGNFLPYAS